VVAKVRKRIAVSKREMRKFDMQRFNVTKVNEIGGKEHYQVKVSNKFAALENLDDDVDINRNITENIKIQVK
jgi:hypothetical protein